MTTTIRNTANSAPGVYVYEVPSGSAPILGVGTSTAGFIGVFQDTVSILEPNPEYNQNSAMPTDTNSFIAVDKTVNELMGKTLEEAINYTIPKLLQGSVLNIKEVEAIKATDTDASIVVSETIYKVSESISQENLLVGENISVTVDNNAVNLYQGQKIDQVVKDKIEKVLTDKEWEKNGVKILRIVQVNTNNNDLNSKKLAQDFQLNQNGLTERIEKDTKLDRKTAELICNYSNIKKVKVKNEFPFISKNFTEYFPLQDGKPRTAITEEVMLCTNFGEFKKFFGDFSTDPGQNILAHAVYGFFRNGGTRCYVVRVKGNLENFNNVEEITKALDKFAAIDEIAIVAAPGITNKKVLKEIADYIVKEPVKNWVAVFDSPSEVSDQTKLNPLADDGLVPGKSAYTALYYPWIQVFDPVTKLKEPKGDGLKFVPPSGHMAGIYARVDTQRGVHKAPANEPVLGAVGLKENISKAQQGALNKNGINCIRKLNGSFLVWGARTLGGDANGEFMYLNVRRLFNYLRKSIDEGTQWTVFEPNSPELWARIRRNLNAFLLTVWRSGALFGDTPEKAFYVKCDEENNPLELRDRGQVVIEIGVAVVKPAEFVIFNLSQWAGPGK